MDRQMEPESSGDLARAATQPNDLQRRYEEALTKLTDLQIQLAQALAERDATMQELFESNRYSGALTVERQLLLERLAGAEAQQQMLRDDLAAAKAQQQMLRDDLAAAEAQQQMLRDDLAAAEARKQVLQNYLDSVYASTSWKFAWPVRAAKRLLQGKQP